ncbi:MAG: hypothetical protein EF813_08620 [Methanosarcinales archaeon]|nr:MAG: hypothetical protein EF813_08620 [Methanosarcinales archaeon]
MAEVKMHDDYLIVIPVNVRESLGLIIGETIDFVVEMGKAALYPKRCGVVSVRRLSGIVKHGGMIDEVLEVGYTAINLNTVIKNEIKEIVTDARNFGKQ